MKVKLWKAGMVYCLCLIMLAPGRLLAAGQKENPGYLIVIDPGHQSHSNPGLEPIGPGARKKKKKVSSGTRGVKTKKYEYQLNLTVSLKLRDRLETKGYRVIMVRTSNHVNISNARRAAIANRAGADAFIRIHANGSGNHRKHGAFTISPTRRNRYPVGKRYRECYRLSKCIINAYCRETGAKRLGILKSNAYTGINWCRVPVTLLEMGYMSNPREDRLMASASYQEKMVQGIVNGLDDYFGLER